jgi:thioredoxin-related protein
MRIIKTIKAVSFLMALLFSFSTYSQEAVHWISFEKAVELTRTKPKHIIIDIYTTWCGPCKMMSKNTFENPVIAKFINEHYYAVKFDAENFDTLKFVMMIPDTTKDKKGKVIKTGTKKRQVVYVNPAPKGTPRSPHQFAQAILDGNLSYPSIVFLNEKVQRIDILKGYYPPDKFEPIVKYIGSGAYIKTKYDIYLKSFKGEL